MDYIQFNLIEGLFWIGLGIVLIVLARISSQYFRRLIIFSASILILFGISDFAEIKFGSFFEPGMTWLFVWKILCVVGLVTAVVWYLWIRIYQTKFKK